MPHWKWTYAGTGMSQVPYSPCQQRTIAESRYGRGMIKVGVGMNSLSMDTRCAACWLGLVVSICRSVKGPDLVILFVGPGHTKSLR